MRVLVPALLVALVGCQDGVGAEIALRKKPRADLDLKKASVEVTHTSSTEWTLTKVGSQGASTITWQATATEGTTTSGLLIANGYFKIKNKGQAGATIGNIVVNLQTKHGHRWFTRSSVIADATQDDAATQAYVDSDKCSDGEKLFTENAASGHLLFTDATTNSTFALVPQVTIEPGATQKLRFSASFDNTVLNIPVGTKVRTEIIVSFGNAKAGRSSAHNLDINGNGIIDPDEDWVQSVSQAKTDTVPAQTPSNATVTLSDSVQDITTTGTATFSNPVITINGLQAFVTVNFDGGASGGTITNCAHLTGSGQTTTVDDDQFPNVTPIDLTACDTQTVGPHTCVPGTVGCGWEDGQIITYTQGRWGDPNVTAGQILGAHYDSVYASSFGIVEVGIPGAAGYSMQFTSAQMAQEYQPSSGAIGPLTADLQDPILTSSGAFGGEVLGLRFNIDYSDAGHTLGSSGLRFGDLTLCGLTDTPGLNGMSVRAFLDLLNTALGGGSTPYSIDALYPLSIDVNASFDEGAVNLFAQDHLFNGACP